MTHQNQVRNTEGALTALQSALERVELSDGYDGLPRSLRIAVTILDDQLAGYNESVPEPAVTEYISGERQP